MRASTVTAATILQDARDALASDTVLNDWCQSNFSKAVSVYLGIDEANPPADSEYPLASILGISQVRGESQREIVWEVGFGFALLKEGKTVSGDKTTYDGMILIEALRDLCEDALFRARIGGVDSESESVSINDYPLFVNFTTMKLKGLKTSRQGLPAR